MPNRQAIYPLRFQPIFRQYLWGGDRLRRLLGKRPEEEGRIAESWEIVDHGTDQSVVLAGPLAGRTLGELTAKRSDELLGSPASQAGFPLLLKFLDAHQPLSVQVHPDDVQAARQNPPDRGKTEAWYVLHADPGSVIYAGLKRGFDRRAFEREVRRGTTELCLHRIEPREGDCVFIPAGVVHALGAGLMVAEIQQSSDTTFRLFDWNRLGPDGQPRLLHVDQALHVIDYEHGPVFVQRPQPTGKAFVERLVECDKFVWDRWRFTGEESIGGDGRCHLLAVAKGSITITGDPAGAPLERGQTMLIPAACPALRLSAAEDCELLDAYLPD
jgi:mannose-6-phosphate isomerase